jgi:hypothetical protein
MLRQSLVWTALLCSLAPAANAQFTQQGPILFGSGGIYPSGQGYAVAVSADGNTAIVGGYDDNNLTGAAWVFTRTGGVWSQQGSKLVGSGAFGPAQQGISVAMSADGNTALVGGFADNNYAGAAWVFTRSNGVWSQQGNKLVGSDGTASSEQGLSVALSADGNTALIGYPSGSPTGAAWTFTRSSGVWMQSGKLSPNLDRGPYYSVYSVALSADGRTALLGGLTDDVFSAVPTGWVFTHSTGRRTNRLGRNPSDGQPIGSSVCGALCGREYGIVGLVSR